MAAKKKKKKQKLTGITRVFNNVTTVLVVLLVILAIMLVGFRFIGFDTYVVLSGSMEPAHKTGALIYARDANTDELEVGDVITFQGQSSETLITHRIIEITEDSTGRIFTTKGDANQEPDAQPVPEDNVNGKVLFSIPYMGYVANYIQNPPGLYFAAAVGVILILLMFVTDMLIEDDKKSKKKAKNTNRLEGEKANEKE